MTGPETPFVAGYSATLERHLRTPGETGLRDAYELGREALRTGTTLLQLVEAHLAAQRALAVVSPTTRQDAADGFLGEALAAYEVAQRGFAEIQESVHAEQCARCAAQRSHLRLPRRRRWCDLVGAL